MRFKTLHRAQCVAAPLAEVFAFFCHARNLDRITPPWLHFRVVGQTDCELKAGTLIHYQLAWHGIPLRWISRIEEWRPPELFVDVQVKGPYALWHHTHSFEACDGGTLITDVVRYAVPSGALGDLLVGWLVRRDVERIFDYRAKRIPGMFKAQLVGEPQSGNDYR